MAQYITPEQRAKVLSAIKDEGMSIPDAAKTFLVSESTLQKWVRKQTRNSHTSSSEVQRLRQRIQELHTVIGKLVEHMDKKRKDTFLGT